MYLDTKLNREKNNRWLPFQSATTQYNVRLCKENIKICFTVHCFKLITGIINLIIWTTEGIQLV